MDQERDATEGREIGPPSGSSADSAVHDHEPQGPAPVFAAAIFAVLCGGLLFLAWLISVAINSARALCRCAG